MCGGIYYAVLYLQVTAIFVNEAAYYHEESGRGIGLCQPVDWPLA